MSKKLLGIGEVYTYDYKQVHKTRNVGFGYYDPNKVSTTSSTDGYVLVDGVLSVVNEDGSNEPGPTPPAPSLPPNTVRVRTSDGNVPYKTSNTTYETATLVPGTNNVYDVYKSGTSLASLLAGSTNVIEVLDANTTDITSMGDMFNGCTNLKSVPLFDTSKVIRMNYMFYRCNKLTSIPLFDTSNVTTMYYMCTNCTSLSSVPLLNTSKIKSMSYMFDNCYNVEYGALALYQQASTQSTPPTGHECTFRSCGEDTETGSAELAQIPSNWK